MVDIKKTLAGLTGLWVVLILVGARHAVPLQGLPLSPDTAFAANQENGQPCPPECVTDSMEIVTWYPSPYNEYEELRLSMGQIRMANSLGKLRQLGKTSRL